MSATAALRLLTALLPPGAYGWWPDAASPTELRVVARRRNVSVEAGRFPASAVDLLLAAGLVAWEEPGPSQRARLVLTAEGRGRADLAAGPCALEPARLLHGDLARDTLIVADVATPVVVDEAESPLVWLARRKGRDGRPLIDASALEAGERLRRDLTLAQTLPNVTSRWDGMPSSGAAGPSPGHVSDLVLAARQRVTQALEAVGPDCAGLLVDVCGFLKGLERVEGERGWPRRSARIVLTLALAQLARHYGLGPQARGRPSGLRHWGMEDYRPRIGE